jgi:hypothetical protein
VIALLAALLALDPQVDARPGKDAPMARAVQGATGGLPVHIACDSGCGGAASFSDLGAFTAGTTSVNIMAGVFDDTLAAIVAGKAGAPRLTSKRALHFNLRDASGNEIPFPAALDADLGFKVHVQNTLTVSGTVAVSNSFALDATLTGGTAKAIVRGGAKGATAAADVTSTAEGADHQAVDVQVYTGGAAIDPRQATLQAGSTTAVTQATAANLLGTMKLVDTGGTNLASILANDATAIANGVETQPAVARAAPTAVTAGRSEKLQVATDSGALFAAEAATTANTAMLQKAVAVNTTTNVKASAGNVYGASCANANASICWLQFYNTAGSPTCGTSVIWSLAIATSGVLNQVTNVPMANHATGIGMCMGTTATGATACTTANACTIFYK